MVKVMKKIIKWILVILWMIFISIMSTSVGSSSNTMGLFEIILSKISWITSDSTIEILHFILRKGAHVFEYFILTLFLISLLNEYKIKAKNIILIALEISVIYACLDEIHQCFIISRNGKILDVGYDFIGTILASFIISLKNHLPLNSFLTFIPS